MDSPLRLVRVPRHPTGISSPEFTIEVVDSLALFKYTGEDDSDYDGFDEEDEGVLVDEPDYDINGSYEDYEFGVSWSEVDDD